MYCSLNVRLDKYLHQIYDRNEEKSDSTIARNLPRFFHLMSLTISVSFWNHDEKLCQYKKWILVKLIILRFHTKQVIPSRKSYRVLSIDSLVSVRFFSMKQTLFYLWSQEYWLLKEGRHLFVIIRLLLPFPH